MSAHKCQKELYVRHHSLSSTLCHPRLRGDDKTGARTFYSHQRMSMSPNNFDFCIFHK